MSNFVRYDELCSSNANKFISSRGRTSCQRKHHIVSLPIGKLDRERNVSVSRPMVQDQGTYVAST